MRGPSQGNSLSGHERNHLYLNRAGRDFLDVAAVSGLDSPGDGRAAGAFDYDHDGWLDFAVVNANAPLLQLFHNELGTQPSAAGRRPGFVALRFRGANRDNVAAPGKSSRDGFGAVVELTAGAARLLRELRAGEGFAAQSSATMLVGLGNESVVQTLSVRWPSGTTQEHVEIPAFSLVTLFEDAAETADGTGIVVEPYLREDDASGAPVQEGADLSSSAEADDRRLDLGAALGASNTARLRLHVTMATWCPSCRRELPQIAHLRSVFGADELDLVGLPVDERDDADKLATYRAERRPAYRLLDPLDATTRSMVKATVVEALGVDALPAAILTDSEGRVLETLSGVPSVSRLRQWLDVQRGKSGG